MTRRFKPAPAVFLTALILFFQPIYAQNNHNSPLSVVETVADKIIRETTFRFQLVIPAHTNTFDFVQFVDFGRTFGLGKPALAYALSELESRNDTTLTLQVSHNDALKIWINGAVVYEKMGAREVNMQPRERDVALESEFQISLKKGANRILVQSETRGKAWIFYLQPKGALIEDRLRLNPRLGLDGMAGISPEIARLSNWLVLGPFDPAAKNTAYGPEEQFEIGKLYTDGNKQLSWTIPKVEIFADVIDPKPYWGVYYNWNYHTGGVAWAMSNLAEATGIGKYDAYAKRWTDFMLDKKSFIGYQVNTLNGFQSTHHQLFNTPLLDFTAAPALPFIDRLRKQKQFANRSAYVDFVEAMKDYVVHKQIRLAGEGNFNRQTPEKFTTWVDDMYMGIPFLIQASLETTDLKEKQALLNDAASQILAFNRQLFNSNTGLYQHVQYSTRKVQFPYWSRANGWGIWATTEVLQQLVPDHPLRKQILNTYLKHVNALIKLQNPKSGAWHNLLDRPDSYEELSGTAIISMTIARGINQGWLSREKYLPYVKKGWDYISSCIETDGTVHNICVGTMSSENPNDYMTRPKIDDDSHGIIGLIFAGIEIEKLFKPMN